MPAQQSCQFGFACASWAQEQETGHGPAIVADA